MQKPAIERVQDVRLVYRRGCQVESVVSPPATTPPRSRFRTAIHRKSCGSGWHLGRRAVVRVGTSGARAACSTVSASPAVDARRVVGARATSASGAAPQDFAVVPGAREKNQRATRHWTYAPGALTEAHRWQPYRSILLAGPIVRRVEPRLAAVWVALNQPRAVRLLSTTAASRRRSAPRRWGRRRHTLRVGSSLRLAVVVVELKSPALPLIPGRTTRTTSTSTATSTSRRPRPSSIRSHPGRAEPGCARPAEERAGLRPATAPRARLPGRRAAQLRAAASLADRPPDPARQLPPAGVHVPQRAGRQGELRRASFVDDLILKWRSEAGFDANRRPHQLFLTGDQIYADDVDGPMLPMLNRAGKRLLGQTENLPTVYPPKNDPASKQTYLGVPSRRATPCSRRSSPSTRRTRSKRSRTTAPCTRSATPRSSASSRCSTTARTPSTRGSSHVAAHVARGPRALPGQPPPDGPGVRDEVLDDRPANHLISFGEYCAMYLAVWCNAIWERRRPGGPASTPSTRRPPGPLPHSGPSGWFDALDATGASSMPERSTPDRTRPRRCRRRSRHSPTSRSHARDSGAYDRSFDSDRCGSSTRRCRRCAGRWPTSPPTWSSTTTT